MNKIFVVLFSLLVVWAVSDLLPDQAAERFLKTFKKHWELKDEDIFDQDYYYQNKSGKYSREYSMSDFYQNDAVDVGVVSHTSIFTNDGLLKIKFYSQKKSLIGYFLVKPNNNIEGGYKFYRCIDV